jgi:ketosteroid isomerase-like protein
MSEKNKATLMKGNAAIAAGDHEGFLVHCTEDTKWVFVGDQTLSETGEVVKTGEVVRLPISPLLTSLRKNYGAEVALPAAAAGMGVWAEENCGSNFQEHVTM